MPASVTKVDEQEHRTLIATPAQRGSIKFPEPCQGSENLFSNSRQGGNERKVLVAKVAVKLNFQLPK